MIGKLQIQNNKEKFSIIRIKVSVSPEAERLTAESAARETRWAQIPCVRMFRQGAAFVLGTEFCELGIERAFQTLCLQICDGHLDDAPERGTTFDGTWRERTLFRTNLEA